MKRKEKFYIDAKKRKIYKGEEYPWNTLIINTEKLKWNTEYKNRCIQRFVDLLKKRKEIKPKRFVYTGPKKRYFSSKTNNKTKGVYISKTEINIIRRNEETIKIINQLKIKD